MPRRKTVIGRVVLPTMFTLTSIVFSLLSIALVAPLHSQFVDVGIVFLGIAVVSSPPARRWWRLTNFECLLMIVGLLFISGGVALLSI